MEENVLKNKYKEFIKEITVEELKGMCDNGKLNIRDMPDKIWVIDYLGEPPENQADFLLNALVANDIVYMVEIEPRNLFKQIYAVKDYQGQQDIVAVFKDNAVELSKLQSLYASTLNDLTLANYLGQQVQLTGTYEKEEYDPLGFKEQQSKIDEIDEKLKNGEITFGDALKEFGLIDEEDYNNEKVANVIERLINDELSLNDLKDMLDKKEINVIELDTISKIVKQKYPEIHERLNDQVI